MFNLLYTNSRGGFGLVFIFCLSVAKIYKRVGYNSNIYLHIANTTRKIRHSGLTLGVWFRISKCVLNILRFCLLSEVGLEKNMNILNSWQVFRLI